MRQISARLESASKLSALSFREIKKGGILSRPATPTRSKGNTLLCQS